MTPSRTPSDEDYERLLEFRTGLRTFLKWSKDKAAEAGLAPVQHQLLLAIRGHPDHMRGPTIGDIARYLLVKPHTAAELIARASASGLIARIRDDQDGRVVRLHLTKKSEEKLARITKATLEELSRLRPALRPLWDGLRDAR